jgi:hypothetical protein
MGDNRMVSKGLAVAVIILFVGIGIQPAFAVNVSNITMYDDRHDCEICPKISKQNIDRLGSLINKV